MGEYGVSAQSLASCHCKKEDSDINKNIIVLKYKNQRKMTLKNAILAIFFTLYLVSCTKNENVSTINPSSTMIEMEGEGGVAKIAFAGDTWEIAEIINQKGNQTISGDSYSTDGKLITKNSLLSLNELGRLNTIWEDKGFIITKTTLKFLEILLKENCTTEDFSFVIVLKAGDETKNITIKQKKSQGYKYEKIEFSKDKEDIDSIFTQNGTSYKFDIKSSQEFLFLPFSGVNCIKSSYFENTLENALAMPRKDSLKVEIPSYIRNNEIYLNGETASYSNVITVRESDIKNQTEKIVIPSGKSEFSVLVEFKKSKISYKLYLTNNRTKDRKIVVGKWIEIAPTGRFTINWKQ